jgi:hypothetical protein
MPIPESPKPYYQKDALDNAIDGFTRKDNPTQADLNWVETIAASRLDSINIELRLNS